MNKNFRITTDYVLEIYNSDTESYYPIWVGETDGKAYIEVSSEADTTSSELFWDYVNNQLPNPSESEQETSNYRITEVQALQLLNPTTGKYHTINIAFGKDNPLFNVGVGED
jgi:hypothetical protein